MMMKCEKTNIRECAIKSCEARIKHLQNAPLYYNGKRQRLREIELEKVKIAALTLPTQEQMARVWKGCEHCTKQRVPFCYDGANDAVYLLVGNGLASIESDSWEFMCSYCPRCGRPLTPEAWEEQRKRLEGLTSGGIT